METRRFNGVRTAFEVNAPPPRADSGGYGRRPYDRQIPVHFQAFLWIYGDNGSLSAGENRLLRRRRGTTLCRREEAER